MNLTLSRTSTDRHPGCEVGDVLRNLRIQKLRSSGQPHLVDVEQKLTRQSEPFVDAKALVEIGVVDESFPANRRARLLEVAAHDQNQVPRVTLGESL